jgi:hypothetical protein
VGFFSFKGFELLSVQALLDAQNVIEPGVDDPHEGYLIGVAEEGGVDNFDYLLGEDAIDQFEPVLVHHLENGLLGGVASYLYAQFFGHEEEDLRQEVGQFFSMLLEGAGEAEKDAEVLLVAKGAFGDFPLLLLGEVVVAAQQV